ncbi:hypothetical protein N0V82_006865 [Gnomoniopsis sp. IMI 355080]|nr:hypothetical protein N0V82_006865 [Gnomoniopsis sp. IMI 355080]
MDPMISDSIFTAALAGTTSSIPDTINYVDLNQHGLIEHDGSLSRDDAAVGNNFQFNQTIWNEMTMFFTTPQISIEQMATARVGRLNRQRAANPVFAFDDKVAMTSLGETSLVLMTFSNGSIDGGASRQQVDTFFTQERLPFDQGFTVPTTRITADRVQAMGQKITNATGANATTNGTGTATGLSSAGSHVEFNLAVWVMTLAGFGWMLL